MKLIKIAALLMGLSIVGLNICSCSNEPEPVSSDINVISTQAQNTGSAAETSSASYVFDYNNFVVGTEFDESKLPEDWDSEPAADCARVGMGVRYFTSSFEVYMYVDTNLIYQVELLDDTVSTPEGIHIGSTVEEIKLAYGDSPDMEAPNGIAYVFDSYLLQFDINDAGKVTRIFYTEPQV